MKNNLTKLVNTGKQFSIFFINGYQGRYTLIDFDDEALLVQDKNDHQQLIFLHAVSTISLA